LPSFSDAGVARRKERGSYEVNTTSKTKLSEKKTIQNGPLRLLPIPLAKTASNTYFPAVIDVNNNLEK